MKGFGAFLLGGALGALAALAFTPKNGEQMRAMIAEQGGNIVEEATDLGAGLPTLAKEATKDVRDKAGSFVSTAQNKIKGTAPDSEAEAASDELREKIEAARQRIAEQIKENEEATQNAAQKPAQEAAQEEAAN